VTCYHGEHAEGEPCLILCAPSSVTWRRVRECPTCECRRRFVVQSYVWYDAIWTCCACGDSWSAGERMGRPFRRGWRADAIRKAQRKWDAAPTREEAHAQERAMLEPYRASAA